MSKASNDKLSISWKSDISSERICDFFQALAVLVVLYIFINLTLMNPMEEKKIDRKYSRMLCVFEEIQEITPPHNRG